MIDLELLWIAAPFAVIGFVTWLAYWWAFEKDKPKIK